MAEHDRAKHDLLGKLVRFRLDHQHRVLRACDDEIELRLVHLVNVGVQNVLVANQGNASTCDGTIEGNTGNSQRGGGRHHRHDIGIVLEVMAQNGRDDLRVVLVAAGKKRTNRPVDQAGGQNLLLGRTTFALEEAARNAAGRVGLFLIVHGEGEEVEAWLRLPGGNYGRQNRGFSVGGENGTVRLTGDLARFQRQRAPAPVDLDGVLVKHIASFACGLASRPPWPSDRPVHRSAPSRRSGMIGKLVDGPVERSGHSARIALVLVRGPKAFGVRTVVIEAVHLLRRSYLPWCVARQYCWGRSLRPRPSSGECPASQ